MTVSEADLMADEEEFHNSYWHYMNAVEMLSKTPEEQCQMMGNNNVAWEIKDDAAAGKYLVNRGYLSPTQEAWVVALAAALEAVNTMGLPAGSDNESNLVAMQHPSWEPVRFLAAEVAKQLAPFSQWNSTYLKLGNSAA